MNKLHRSKDKKIAGVCAGIAETFGIDPLYIRLGFLASIFMGGSGILLYLLFWIILPEMENSNLLPIKKLYRSRKNRFIAGICGGFAEYIDWDVSLIRIILAILMINFGSGLLLYIILWILIPLEPETI